MTELDLHQVLREIDEEVAARRASGDFPPGMERDLDLVFARFAPAATSTDDLDALIEQADRGAFVDVDAPTASRLPFVAVIKRTQRKLLSWYLRYIAQQVSVFATAVVGALRLLGARVATLEASTPGADPALRAALRAAVPPVDLSGVGDAIAVHLDGATGRVLVAECGDGAMVRRLAAAAVDAYGCEPRLGVAEAASTAGLDVRPDDVIEHLQAVADDALGGLVLAGEVDRAPLGQQLALADLASRVLMPGGRLALVGTEPESWGASTSVIAADLSPGRPLHAATWTHLLAERGFAEVHASGAPPSYVVTAVRR